MGRMQGGATIGYLMLMRTQFDRIVPARTPSTTGAQVAEGSSAILSNGFAQATGNSSKVPFGAPRAGAKTRRSVWRVILATAGIAGVATSASAWAADIDANATSQPAQGLGSAKDKSKSDASSGDQNEIIITALKRPERTIDAPASITAVTGKSLEDQKISSLEQLSSFVPGMTVQSNGGPGQRVVVLRGLSTGSDQSQVAGLVATFIDDEPVGGSTGGGRGTQYGIDLMPYDLDRIEVLRGPQGTLYGADAMGGIVRYVLKKPSLEGFDFRVGGDVFGIDGAAKPGWNGRASADITLVPDQLGVRLSYFNQYSPGYIDNVGTGTRHSNHSTQTGGRIAVLWRPVDWLSIQGNFIGQNINQPDSTVITLDEATRQPLYGRNKKFTYFLEPFHQTVRDYSLRVGADLGFATLTSLTSYSKIESTRVQDLTFPDYTAWFGYPDALTWLWFKDEVTKFNQDLRLASSAKGSLEWIAGAQYTIEHPAEIGDEWLAYNPDYTPLPPPYNNLASTGSAIPRGTYKELAAYGNVTYKFSPKFDVSGGLRYSANKISSCFGAQTGIYGGTPYACSSQPYQYKLTWRADARYHITPDQMFYVTASTGYRPGGLETPDPVHGIPPFYSSDSITNYEAGLKGLFFDRRLKVESTLFYIDWRDIQIVVPNNGFPFLGNGGKASSKGVELAVAYNITNRLSLNASGAYTDAKLDEDAPAAGGVKGEQLPQSARWTGSVGAEYRWPLDDHHSLFVGGSYRYRSHVKNQFDGTGFPEPMGPQNLFDFAAGITTDHLEGRIYLKNAFNDRSYTGLQFHLVNTQLVPVQPRTFGISLDYRY